MLTLTLVHTLTQKVRQSNRKKYTVKRVMYKIDEIDIAESLPFHVLSIMLSLSSSIARAFKLSFSLTVSLKGYQSFRSISFSFQ